MAKKLNILLEHIVHFGVERFKHDLLVTLLTILDPEKDEDQNAKENIRAKEAKRDRKRGHRLCRKSLYGKVRAEKERTDDDGDKQRQTGIGAMLMIGMFLHLFVSFVRIVLRQKPRRKNMKGAEEGGKRYARCGALPKHEQQPESKHVGKARACAAP